MKQVMVEGQRSAKVTVTAYHDGNNKVTLGLSTVQSKDVTHWDAVLRDPGDFAWWSLDPEKLDPQKAKNTVEQKQLEVQQKKMIIDQQVHYFKLIFGMEESIQEYTNMIHNKLDTIVESITTSSNDAGWFET